jgi:hypothetical protein
VQALASGDKRLKEKIELEIDVEILRNLKNGFKEEQYRLSDILRANIEGISRLENSLELAKSDKEKVTIEPKITVDGRSFSDKKDTGERLEFLIAKAKSSKEEISVGSVGGFELKLKYFPNNNTGTLTEPHIEATLQGGLRYNVELAENNPMGNITRLENLFKNISNRAEKIEAQIQKLKLDNISAENGLSQTFPNEEELNKKNARLAELNAIFEVPDDDIIDTENSDFGEKVTADNSIAETPKTAVSSENKSKIGTEKAIKSFMAKNDEIFQENPPQKSKPSVMAM